MNDDNVRPADFSGSADDEIAALLASLDAPAMPEQVRARLDAVIAEEARERQQAASSGRGRRRFVWAGAAAAAVIVVAGAGVLVSNLGQSGIGSSNSSVSADAKALSTAPEAAGGQGATPGPSGGTSLSSGPGPATQASALPVVRAGHLAQDARLLLAGPARASGRVQAQDSTGAPLGPTSGPSGSAQSGPDTQGCLARREPQPSRQVIEVSYQGSAAILVITTKPPRTATVFSCEGAQLQQVPLD